ncbi:XF1762 family protein [Streptomyces sp. VTCC 41912]|uniref:XF1762 family protein n=1 Tax=Streptomyces sp. VTCC 41912 TaxID=3383243 RepID=UPI003896D0BB
MSLALGGAEVVTPDGEPLEICPVTLQQAKDFVREHHRHHRPPVGHKVSLGVRTSDGTLRGVAILSRPVARAWDNGRTLEVTRIATDGTKNACSALYGASWRAAKALGYQRLVTYTQDGESGASLRGAGWKILGQRKARRGWDTPSRQRDGHGNDLVERTVWEAA